MLPHRSAMNRYPLNNGTPYLIDTVKDGSKHMNETYTRFCFPAYALCWTAYYHFRKSDHNAIPYWQKCGLLKKQAPHEDDKNGREWIEGSARHCSIPSSPHRTGMPVISCLYTRHKKISILVFGACGVTECQATKRFPQKTIVCRHW